MAVPDRSDSVAPLPAPSVWPMVSLPQLPLNQTLAWRMLLVLLLPSLFLSGKDSDTGAEEVCSSQ